MGVCTHIDYKMFPKQSNHSGKRAKVCFNYNLKKTIGGVVVRDDMEEPWITIIKLDDGRHVLSIECQWSSA